MSERATGYALQASGYALLSIGCALIAIMLLLWPTTKEECPPPEPDAQTHGIVYTRAPIDFHKPPTFFENASSLMRFTEVAAITMGFGESDVVIRNPDGTDTMVYNCTTSPENCAAQEGRVAPDGNRIAFSVTKGTLVQENTGIWLLRPPISSKIYIYNIATKQTTVIPNQSDTVINRSPDWIDDNTLVYASNAGNIYAVRPQFNCHQGVYPPGHPSAGKPRGYNNGACASITFAGPEMKALQIWRMWTDGTHQKNLTPQEAGALRPTVLRNEINKGRIAFSSFQDQEDRCWYQGAGGMGTCANRWWLMTMAPDGTGMVSFMGAHHSPTLNKHSILGNTQEEFMALRAAGELPDGEICTGNYYRGNHMGGKSSVLCATAPMRDFQIEGCSTPACLTGDVLNNSTSVTPGSARYIPQSLRYLASFSVGSDNNQAIGPDGRTLGGMNYISALSNGHALATWWRGWCYNQPWSGTPVIFDGTSASIGGEPLCDMNVVEILNPKDTVTDPFDQNQMRVVIGSDQYDEFDAQEIIARPVTHVQPPLDENAGCYIEVVDLRESEQVPLNPVYHWNMRAEEVGMQGNAVDPRGDLHKRNVKALAIYGIQHHTTYYPDPKWKAAVNYTGYESVWKIGQWDMMDDGSLKMQVPCEQPYYMAAVNAKGKWLTHDPWLHVNQKGETKTCHGCHDGHSVERRSLLDEPQVRFAKTQAAATHPPLINGHEIVTFAQVGPIIEKACSGCHTGFQNDSLLWSRVFADQIQLDFPWMTQMHNRNGGTDLPRPYWTGLMGRYARQSIWFWVAEGQRTDEHTNEEADDDQDYPTGHPKVNITPEEIRLVADYVQLGAPM